VRQFLVESVVLAVVGGLVGLFVASWAVDGLLSAMGPDMAAGIEAGLDARLLLFNLGLSVVTGLLLGVAPALQMTRPRAILALKDEGGTVSSGTGQARLRRGLVVAQVALSLLLLVAAGLFGRSVVNLMRVDPGFRVSGVTTFEVDPTTEGQPAARVYAFYHDLLDRLRSLPGVGAVGATTPSPLTNSDRSANFSIEGYQAPDAADARASVGMVSAGFFETLRIHVSQGRVFDDDDVLGGRKVAVVNEAFVRKYAQGRPLLGRHLATGSGTNVVADREIVGVVGDYKHDGLRESVKPTVFFPYPQDERPSGLTFYVRSSRSGTEIAAGVRRAVRELDQNLPVFDMKPMSALIDEVTTTERLIAVLAAAFGLLATVLAAVGLYGVIAYIVLRRTREIGVRMALGAPRREILRLVMREVGILLAVGLAIGVVAAALASRLVASQLYGLGADDPMVFLAALAGLSVVALVAGTIPARRAAAIDPIKALRRE
jgi:predicted permease